MTTNEGKSIFFEVINKKFYILEQRDVPSEADEEDEVELLEKLKEQYFEEMDQNPLTLKGNLTKAFKEWRKEKEQEDKIEVEEDEELEIEDEEDKEDEEVEVKEVEVKDNSIAWVYQDEKHAIKKINELMAAEELDLDGDLDGITDHLSSKYNLQEIEITEDKYNMKAISWLKIALIGLANK